MLGEGHTKRGADWEGGQWWWRLARGYADKAELEQRVCLERASGMKEACWEMGRWESVYHARKGNAKVWISYRDRVGAREEVAMSREGMPSEKGAEE